MTDRDQEQLRALETERAFLLENGKTDRADQVDAQLDAVRARIHAARVADGLETTQAEPPPQTTAPAKPPRARGRKAAK